MNYTVLITSNISSADFITTNGTISATHGCAGKEQQKISSKYGLMV